MSNRKALKIGITGGIGSGKSLVCKIFAQLAIPIYLSDLEAKRLINSHPKIIQELKENFGNDLYNSNNELNKAKLSEIIFEKKDALQKVNSIIHPRVREHFLQWTQKQQAVYILKEAAILFESGAYKDLDYIITVYAPKEIRLARSMKRDEVNKETIEARMKNQMSEEEKIERADFVIYNDEKQLLIPQILKIHKQIYCLSCKE